jgi:hypothetical protein
MVTDAKDMNDETRHLAAEIACIEGLYRPVALDIDRLALDNQREAATNEIVTKCRPLPTALIKASNAYAEVTQRRAAKMVQEAEDDFSTQRNFLMAI